MSLPVVNCGECERAMELVEADSSSASRPRLLWRCVPCGLTHGAHPDGRPLGIPGTRETIDARKAAHKVFDRLWEEGLVLDRTAAYRWLAGVLRLSSDEAHIGRFDAARCRYVMKLAGMFLRAWRPEASPLVDLDPALDPLGLAPPGVDVDDILDAPPPKPKPARRAPRERSPRPRPFAFADWHCQGCELQGHARGPGEHCQGCELQGHTLPEDEPPAPRRPPRARRAAPPPPAPVQAPPRRAPCTRCGDSGEVATGAGIDGGFDQIEMIPCECPVGVAFAAGLPPAPAASSTPEFVAAPVTAAPAGSSTADDEPAFESPDGW